MEGGIVNDLLVSEAHLTNISLDNLNRDSNTADDGEGSYEDRIFSIIGVIDSIYLIIPGDSHLILIGVISTVGTLEVLGASHLGKDIDKLITKASCLLSSNGNSSGQICLGNTIFASWDGLTINAPSIILSNNPSPMW